MSSEYRTADEIQNPLCIKCGKPTTETADNMGRGTVYIHQDCTTQVIFKSDQKEEVDA